RDARLQAPAALSIRFAERALAAAQITAQADDGARRSLVSIGQARVPLAARDGARVGARQLSRRRDARDRGSGAWIQDDAGARGRAAPRGRGSLAMVPA